MTDQSPRNVRPNPGEGKKTRWEKAQDVMQTLGFAGGIGATVMWGVSILMGKSVPDTAPDWAKGVDQLYSGSKKDPQDEIAMIKIRGELRKKYAEDLPWWDGYNKRVMQQYGDTPSGRARFKSYNHQARQYIVQMREKVPQPKTHGTDPKTKKPVTTEPPAQINYEPPVEFIHEVVDVMMKAYAAADGTDEEKYAAADTQVNDFLRQHDFPVPHGAHPFSAIRERVSDFTQTIDLEPAKQAVRKASRGAGQWVDNQHKLLEKRNNRGGWFTGVRRWYRSLR